MPKGFRELSLVAALLGVSACAPPGQGALGYRDIDWPRADHFMTPSENREIEVLLGRLGYLQATPDTQISTGTRGAIRTYQRDIGAPVTGYVSIPLLQSLRVNAPAGPAIETAPPPTTTTTARRTNTATPQRKTTPVTTSTPSTGGGGGTGGGGTGGGAWN